MSTSSNSPNPSRWLHVPLGLVLLAAGWAGCSDPPSSEPTDTGPTRVDTETGPVDTTGGTGDTDESDADAQSTDDADVGDAAADGADHAADGGKDVGDAGDTGGVDAGTCPVPQGTIVNDGTELPTSGDLSCAEIVACANENCPNNEITCLRECEMKGTGDGRGLFKSTLDCMEKFCDGNYGSPDCQCGNCPGVLEFCFGGTDVCRQRMSCQNYRRCRGLFVCHQGCGFDASCRDDCERLAVDGAAEDYDPFISCVKNNCSDNPTDPNCICSECASEADGCHAAICEGQ